MQSNPKRVTNLFCKMYIKSGNAVLDISGWVQYSFLNIYDYIYEFEFQFNVTSIRSLKILPHKIGCSCISIYR